MSLRAFSEEKQERKLIMLLYIGTLMLMLTLMYATYSNMRSYDSSVKRVKRYDMAVAELRSAFSSVQEQELGVRGFLLTNDSAYLVPYHGSNVEALAYLASADTLLEDPSWHAPIAVLVRSVNTVDQRLRDLLDQYAKDPSSEDRETAIARAKTAMDDFRAMHTKVADNARSERARSMSVQLSDRFDTPIAIVLYALLTLLATTLLFWRLSRALANTARARSLLQEKLSELDHEVAVRGSIQHMLGRVLDMSPNGILTMKALRDGSGKVVDMECETANPAACAMLDKTDLVGGRLSRMKASLGGRIRLDEFSEVVRSRTPFRTEFEDALDGSERWFGLHVVPFEDGVLVTLTNTTDQKHAQDVSSESDRLALVGQITRTVAHEVRNPLTNIHLSLEQLRDEFTGQGEDVDPFFEIIQRNLERIGKLIREMLESSKDRELQLERCQFRALVNEALASIADRMELKHMDRVIRVEDGLPDVHADRDLINMAMTNILVNAIEAMEPGKGILTIRVERMGNEVVMELKDNGKGIPPEELERLFTPFYSSRTGGLGLGLTTARNILNGHKVRMGVASKPNEGTSIMLRFPKETLIEDGTTRTVAANKAIGS